LKYIIAITALRTRASGLARPAAVLALGATVLLPVGGALVEPVVLREIVEVTLPLMVEVEVESELVVVTVVELADVGVGVAESVVALTVPVPVPPKIANWGP
jgi:hypothetical protein